MYGAKSSDLCRSPATYAVPASFDETSIMLTVPHSGMALGVMFSQCWPPSRVSCIKQSSVPTQIRSFWTGDSTTEKIVSYTSTPVLSFVIGPPEACCFCLSLRVRSGLMLLQLIPASVVLKSTSPAKYSVFGSCGENTIGSVH